MRILLLILVCMFALGRAEESVQPEDVCIASVVKWRDAVLYTRNPNLDNISKAITAEIVSFGCVFTLPDRLVVAMSFSSGKPDVVLVVPKDWVIEVKTLIPKGEK